MAGAVRARARAYRQQALICAAGRTGDAFGRDRASIGAAVVDRAYLDGAHPQLAVGTLRSAQPVLLEEPQSRTSWRAPMIRVAAWWTRWRHRPGAGSLRPRAGAGALHTQLPSYACSERTFAKLDTHKSALERMVRWGIVDPRVDPRAQQAYDMAFRRARIAVGELPGKFPSN